MVTADRATLPWWWRLLRACCFVLAGIAVMVVFVCMASEGGNGETEKKNSHQERVCLSVAAPLMIGFGGRRCGSIGRLVDSARDDANERVSADLLR